MGGGSRPGSRANRDERMSVAPRGAGPSHTRDIDGQPRSEGSSRSPQDITVEFLKAQEEALADDPIPLSRREQVLRYFTELRRRLEAEQPAKNDDGGR